MEISSRPLTILFMPESAYGPTNQCIGIGDLLLKRGHRVVFAAETSWKGKLNALGFEEDLVQLAPLSLDADEQDPGKVLEGVHQGYLTRISQTDDRTIGIVHKTDVASANRWCYLLRTST